MQLRSRYIPSVYENQMIPIQKEQTNIFITFTSILLVIGYLLLYYHINK